ncbi:MAG: suppressor of fused domain protein [Mariniblastus sp.]|nr:suppressor of fused domain protein [Mariniblastus sp.]
MTPTPDNSNQLLAEPEILIFETSPFGTLDAIVQHDGRAVYFYLNQSRQSSVDFGTRACWVRNLQIGPLVINEDEMQQGIPPMLSRTHCVYREGQTLPDPEQLSIIWLEEGNGAALVETDVAGKAKTLCLIPPWSGLEGFHGYALECAIESPLCWPMPDNEKLDTRVIRAKEFWNSFLDSIALPKDSSQPSAPDPFAVLKSSLLECYQPRFNNEQKIEPKYFSIGGETFPPCELVQYSSDQSTVLATVGMSLCPQPAVELFANNPPQQRRIELAIRMPGNLEEDASRSQVIAEQIGKLAGYPWRNLTWFGAGHTCQLPNVWDGFELALIISELDFPASLKLNPTLPDFRQDPVNMLWLIPISLADKQQLEEKQLTTNQVASLYLDFPF